MLFFPGGLETDERHSLDSHPRLVFSLIESKFILPYHLTLCRFDKNTKLVGQITGKSFLGIENFIKHSYQPFLALCLRNRPYLSAFLGLFAITLGLIFGGHVPSIRGIPVPSDYISVKVFMQDGVPASSTEKALEQIERARLRWSTFEQRGANPFKHAMVTMELSLSPGGPEFLQYCDGIKHGGNQRRIDQVRRQKTDCASNFRSMAERIGPLPGIKQLYFGPLQPEELDGHWREISGKISTG